MANEKTAGGKPATAAATGKMIRPETAENAATDASPKSKPQHDGRGAAG
ncbi:hypothetical protein HMSSN036_72220 [Paenibacillus macerans]|nr:hypothetical protein HMSSN036_72220 [Paenibacillus macerans]